MDMSAAALPPCQPAISDADRAHPRFAEYRAYRQGCVRLMVDASPFSDWLSCREREEYGDKWAEHPRYEDFRRWMIANKGGARKCPAGCFPENFQFWLEGGRW